MPDFGLSTVYSLTTQGRCVDNPLWLAPEVIRGVPPPPPPPHLYRLSSSHGHLLLPGEAATEKADVYSFGILLWEIASHETPYSEYDYAFVSVLEDRLASTFHLHLSPLSWSSLWLLTTLPHRRIVKEQLRPTIPHDTPWQLTNLIRSCWKDAQLERPSFYEIVQRLSRMLNEIEEDEAERKRLQLEYERELSSNPARSVLGKSFRRRGTVGSNEREDSEDGAGGQKEQHVVQVNPLLRLRRNQMAHKPLAPLMEGDDLPISPQSSSGGNAAQEQPHEQQPRRGLLRLSSTSNMMRRKPSVGSSQEAKARDSLRQSDPKL